MNERIQTMKSLLRALVTVTALMLGTIIFLPLALWEKIKEHFGVKE